MKRPTSASSPHVGVSAAARIVRAWRHPLASGVMRHADNGDGIARACFRVQCLALPMVQA